MAPSVIFIIGYRNRPYQLAFFTRYMSAILGDLSYEMYFAHQSDDRAFNRGAMKNIGFMAARDKYPNDYRDITFVFNDIDTVPYSNIFSYETRVNVAKHFYGYTYALGGIVSMLGRDFEKINGFPCYWSWGHEDNVLQDRCVRANIEIDRGTFHKIGSPQILHLFDGVSRIINRHDPWRSTHDDGIDGIRTISKLNYAFSSTSSTESDNAHVHGKDVIQFINVFGFEPLDQYSAKSMEMYDIRDPPRRAINPAVDAMPMQKQQPKQHATQHVVDMVNSDWTRIPYKVSALDKLLARSKELVKSGRPVPADIQRQIEVHERKRGAAEIPKNESAQIESAPIESTQIKQQQQQQQQQPPNSNSNQSYWTTPYPTAYKTHFAAHAHAAHVPAHVPQQQGPKQFGPGNLRFIMQTSNVGGSGRPSSRFKR